MSHPGNNRLAELFRYRDLIYMLVVRDLKTRYKGSFLGFLWTLLNPLLLFGVFYIVFTVLARFDSPYYSLQLLIGILFWNIITETVNTSIYCLIGNASLIKKIYLPAEVFPLSIVIGVAVNFCFSLPVLLIFFLIQGVWPGWGLVWLAPGFIVMVLLALGLGFIVSALAVYIKDTNHFVPVLLQIGFFASPVLYPLTYALERFGESWHIIFLLNPFALWVTFVRNQLLPGEFPAELAPFLALSVLTVLLILGLGWVIFSRLRPKFAEYL